MEANHLAGEPPAAPLAHVVARGVAEARDHRQCAEAPADLEGSRAAVGERHLDGDESDDSAEERADGGHPLLDALVELLGLAVEEEDLLEMLLQPRGPGEIGIDVGF